MAGGRPSPIDAVIGYRETDEGPVEVTVSSRIVAALRVGAPLYESADAAGVPRETVRGWIKLAGTLAIQHGGDFTTANLTAHEARCVEFSQSVEEARAAWLIDSLSLHERIARGGIPQEIVTIERGPSPGDGEPGPILKSSTRTTVTLPSERALEWRMKHLRPDLYSDRLELTGPGGGPIELSQQERANALLKLAQGVRKVSKSESAPRRRRSTMEVPQDESDPA